MVSLQAADYVVIAILLFIPLVIGVFFAIRDAKRVTRDEYLLGGRQMALVPVTLSMFVTFQSAISLIGVPSETYMHGPTFISQYFGIGASFLLACFTVVPLLYPLRITSVFEYLQMRFESRTVRLVSTVLGMMQVFFYLVLVLLAPGLALEAAAGIPLWMSVVIVGVTGTIYTAVGGMKSVVWTDAFQSLIVFVGVLSVIIKSTIDVGGIGSSWSLAESGRRTNFNKFVPDPRIRHTWYGAFVIGFVSWMINLFSQSSCLRISSMKSVKSVRMAMVLNIPLNLVYGFVCVTMGMCMYAYFLYIRCDPLKAGIVKNENQIALVFVLHAMQDHPGFAGVYMSSVFSGALSSLSSGINALAANTMEDYLQTPLKSVSEKTATTITKILVFAYGTLIVLIVYLGRNLKGQIQQMSASVVGCFGSVVLGMFLLGCTVPWANKYGVMTGAAVSIIVNVWLVVGNKLHGRQPVPLPPAPTQQCFILTNSSKSTSEYGNDNNMSHYLKNNTMHSFVSYSVQSTPGSDHVNTTTIISSDTTFSVFDISYEWYPLFGVVICYVVGVIISRITRHKLTNNVVPEPRLIIPCLRKPWGLDTPPEVDLILGIDGGKDTLETECL